MLSVQPPTVLFCCVCFATTGGLWQRWAASRLLSAAICLNSRFGTKYKLLINHAPWQPVLRLQCYNWFNKIFYSIFVATKVNTARAIMCNNYFPFMQTKHLQLLPPSTFGLWNCPIRKVPVSDKSAFLSFFFYCHWWQFLFSPCLSKITCKHSL